MSNARDKANIPALNFLSTGIDDNATSTAVTIDSSGNVGIGTSSPSTSLHISQSQPIITLTDTDTSVSHQLSGQSSSRHLNLKVDTGGLSGSPVFNLSMQDSIKLSVLNDGNIGIGTTTPSQKLDVVGSIEVSDGIYVGGTAAANKLDDYEEGTWTPTIVQGYNTVSYNLQGGTYTKIGRNVFFTLRLELTGSTANATGIKISIPFTSASSLSGSFAGGGNFAYVNVNIVNSLTTNPPIIYVPQNQNFLSFYKTEGNTFNGNNLNSPSNPDFYIFGNYLTN